MNKFRCEVTGIGENTWSSNGKDYDTIEAAEAALDSLADRWFGFDRSRIVPSDTPRGQKVSDTDVLYQNLKAGNYV